MTKRWTNMPNAREDLENEIKIILNQYDIIGE